jgi:hypothetical protein
VAHRGEQAIILILQTLPVAAIAAWGGLALWVQRPAGRVASVVLIILWLASALAFAAGPISAPWPAVRAGGAVAFPVLFALLLVWWGSVRPSNERDWIPEVARQLQGTVEGDVVTLRNVRNFQWRSADDVAQRWETRQYHLSALRSVDLALSYWAGPAIAHVMVSFGFDNDDHVAFSVEIRRKKGDKFSELGGFFRQYELSIVAADERDILRVRTNVRGEDGYLYRVQMPMAAARSLFLAYVERANRLVNRPRFYNTITANCTTLVYQMIDRIVPGLPMSYQLLASGYLPEYLYRLDALSGAPDLAEYRRRGRYTGRALENTDLACFSRDIRRGVPGIETG